MLSDFYKLQFATKRARLRDLWLPLAFVVALILDLFLSHPQNAYLCDPVSGILISLAISAAISAGTAGLEYLLTKKQKQTPVDRGKVDDIRASIPGYGEFIPKGWGTFRVAPIWVWESPAVDHPVTTPGHSGGKGIGGGGQSTPTTVDHVYLKSVAGVFHDGLINGGVRRIWFDTDLVYNGITSDAFSSPSLATISSQKYEAELGTLTGGAAVSTQAECSGGKKVTSIGGAITPFVTSVTLGTLRNNFSGWVGFKLSTGVNTPTINSLGRWRVSGNTGTHELRLYKSDGTLISSAMIDMSTGTVGAFKYVSIAPVTLTASTSYYLLSLEANGGDQWYDVDSAITGLTAGIGTVANGGFSSTGAPTSFTDTGGANNTYGPVSLGIGSTGRCAIRVTAPSTGPYEMGVHYASTVIQSFDVSVDGAAPSSLSCSASGGSGIVAIQTLALGSLTAGDHTIAFSNPVSSAPALDCIDIAPTRTTDAKDARAFVSAIDTSKIPPTDQNIAWPYQNFQPDPGDGGGAGGATGTPFQTFNLGKYGQPSIRIYRGTPTQNADSAIVAQEGSTAASAYRGFAYIVIENLQLQNGRVPNVTLEVAQGVHSVAAIVADIYLLGGITLSQLNLAALAGLHLGSSTIDPGTYSTANWQNKTNTTSGASGSISKTSGTDLTYNAGASHNGTLAAATNGAIRFTANQGAFTIGFGLTASPTQSSDLIFGIQCHHADNSSGGRLTLMANVNGVNSGDAGIGIWAPGDVFQIELRNNKFHAFQNGIELGGFTVPVPSFPLYPAFIAYSTGAGVTAASVSLSGVIGASPSADAGGLLLSSRRTLADLLGDLQTRFQFDMVEVDGVVKAILRNGTTPDITIPYTDMRAVVAQPGSLPEIPAFDCEIHDIDPFLLPDRVDVNYLDPGMDYHNNVQSEMNLGSARQDQQSVSLSIIDNADNMKALAQTLFHKAEMEGRAFNWLTSYKYLHVHPGSIATLTLQSSTHTVRITQAKYSIPAGVIEFQGVRQAPSLYSPTASGSVSDGFEAPIAAHPANTKGVIIDGPLLRAEDAGDGTQPVVYVAMCGRGSGAWNGGFLYEESPLNSGNYELVTTASQASQIGVTVGALASVSDPSVWDRTTSLIVDWYTPTTLESVTEDELLQNPNLNLIAVVNPSDNQVEYVQFKTAVAGTPAAPFLARYTISTFLRGRVGTDANVADHTATDDVVWIDSTIRPRRIELSDLGI